jgi:hypothetical protein
MRDGVVLHLIGEIWESREATWHRLQPHRPLCRGYETAREVISISYAVLRIFGPLARTAG